MGEIKFRCWDTQKKCWLDIDNMSKHFSWGAGGCDGSGICNVQFGGLAEDANVIWVQYTGLLDKTGKEIYEGDAVILRDLIVPDIVSIVKWGECDVYGCGDEPESMQGWVAESTVFGVAPLIPYSSLEVIGNIWANPELVSDG